MDSITANAKKRTRLPQSKPGRTGGGQEAMARVQNSQLNQQPESTHDDQSEDDHMSEQHGSQYHQFDSSILKLPQGVYTGNGRDTRSYKRAPSSSEGFERAVHGLRAMQDREYSSRAQSPTGNSQEQNIPSSDSVISFGSYQQASSQGSLAHGNKTPTPAKREFRRPYREEDTHKLFSREQTPHSAYTGAEIEGCRLSQNPDYAEIEGRSGTYLIHPSKIPAPPPLHLKTPAEKATLARQRMESDGKQTSSVGGWTPTNLPLSRFGTPAFSVRGRNVRYHDSTPTKKGPLRYEVSDFQEEATSSMEYYEPPEQASRSQQEKPVDQDQIEMRVLRSDNTMKVEKPSSIPESESAGRGHDMDTEIFASALDVRAENPTVAMKTEVSYHIAAIGREESSASRFDNLLDVQEPNECMPLLDDTSNSPQLGDSAPSIENGCNVGEVERPVSALNASRPMSKAFLQQSTSVSTTQYTRRSNTASRLFRPFKKMSRFGKRESRVVKKPLAGRPISEPIEVRSPTIGGLAFGEMKSRSSYGPDYPPIADASRLQYRMHAQLLSPAPDAGTEEDTGRGGNGAGELRISKLRPGTTFGSMGARTTADSSPRTPFAVNLNKPLPPLPSASTPEHSSPRTPSASQEGHNASWSYHNRQEYHPKPQWPGQRNDPNLDEFAFHGHTQPLFEGPRSKPSERDSSQSRKPTWPVLHHTSLSRTGAREKDVEERLAARVRFEDQSPQENDPFDSVPRSKKGPVHIAIQRVLSQHQLDYTPTKGIPRSFSFGEMPEQKISSIEIVKMAGSPKLGQPNVELEPMKGLPKHSSKIKLSSQGASESLSVKNEVKAIVPRTSSTNMLRRKPKLENVRERGISWLSKSKPKMKPEIITEDRTYAMTFSPLMADRSHQKASETSAAIEPHTPTMPSQETMDDNLWNAQSAVHAHLARTPPLGSMVYRLPLNIATRQVSSALGKDVESDQGDRASSTMSRRRSGGYEELVIGYVEAGPSRDSGVQPSSVNNRNSIRSLAEDVSFGSEAHLASMAKSILGPGYAAKAPTYVDRVQELEEEELPTQTPIVQTHQAVSPVVPKDKDDDKYDMARNIHEASSSNLPQETAQKFSARGSSKGWDMGLSLPQSRVPEPATLDYEIDDYVDVEDWYSDEEDPAVGRNDGVEGVGLERGNGSYAGGNRSMSSTLSSIDWQKLHDTVNSKKSVKSVLSRTEPTTENLRGDGNVPIVSDPTTVLEDKEEQTLKKTQSLMDLLDTLDRPVFDQLGDRYIMKPKDENLAADMDDKKESLAGGVDKKESTGLRGRFGLKKFLSVANLR